MNVSIIVIGDEILLGQVTDTNSGFLARTLSPMGFEVQSIAIVPDDAQAIANAIEVAMWSDSQLIITTGGLGPTKDDITKSVLMKYFGGALVHNSEVAENIERVFEIRGLRLNDLTRQQALVPSSCRAIVNNYGTAPIMWFEKDGKVLIAMPGVPFETEGMMRDKVASMIHQRFTPDVAWKHHTFIVTDITESDLATRLASFEQGLPAALHLAYLPQPGMIRLRLDGHSVHRRDLEINFAKTLEQLRELLGDNMLHDGDATPGQILLQMLHDQGLTVSTAESCTGGAIASAITAVPGSSECYMGSVVSYSNDVKKHVLGVDSDVLAAHGAVSEPVVRQMAEGVCGVIGTDCSVATSGIAGPGGGTSDKPVGTVWIAVHTPAQSTVACRYQFPGDRARVIDRAVRTALIMLVKQLKKH